MSNYLTIKFSRAFAFVTFLCCFQQAKAQYVTIPDPAFAAYLQTAIPGCMSGSQMDTVCAQANLHLIDVTGLGVTSLSGIEYLPSLSALYCADNNLSVLDLSANTQLYGLVCSNNNLNSLDVEANPALSTLICSNNQLSTLNLPPMTSAIIDCSHNNLTHLDVTGVGSANVDCSYNQLVTLIGADQINLNCSNNQLTSLALGPEIIGVDCSHNNLTSLDCTNCGSVDCSYNQLTSFTAPMIQGAEVYCSHNLLTGITVMGGMWFDCSYNQLSDVTIVSGFDNVDVSHNNLTTFPFYPSPGGTLDCSYNQLTDIADSLDLGLINCSHNQLTTFPIIASTFIHTINCSDNLLTELPTLPYYLNFLSCANNQISCFPGFPESLQYIDISNNPNTCVPNYVSAMTTFPPLCSDDPAINPSGCESYGNIIGSVWLDDNCSLEPSSDSMVYGNLMRLYDDEDNLIGLSHNAGVYGFGYVAEISSTYRLELDTVFGPYNVVCDFPGTDSLVTLSSANPLAVVDFLVSCKSGFDVGCFGVYRAGLVFPGQQHYVDAQIADVNAYHYTGCPPYEGTVTVQIELSNAATFQGPALGALTPSSVNGNTVIYENVSISDDFAGIYSVDTTAVEGDSICVHVTVTPDMAGDYHLANNEFYFCYPVTNSYDPNHKDVYPLTVSPGYDDYLTYTIQFQNTGNAPAFNIRLADTMDANLDLETFEVLNYSHPVNINIMNGIASFRFNNIMLPDSTSNPEGSIGHIQYRVKPKAGLPVGTHIDNTAYIFFDFNDPIVTNTAVTNFVETWGLAETSATGISVYPNPGKGEFTVRGQGKNQTIVVEAYDLFGAKLTSAQGIGAIKIDLEEQTEGIYILKVFVDDKMSTVRVMKQ